MIVRGVGLDGDWNFGKGQNDYVTANDAVAQMIATELRSFLGDCFFDVTDGIDWFNLLGSKQILTLKLAIASRILNTFSNGIQVVTSIQQLDFVVDESRGMTVRYLVTTVFNTPLKGFVGQIGELLTEGGDNLVTEGGDTLHA